MTPFEILDIIYLKKEHDRQEVLSNYKAFVINKGLSFNTDTLFFANAMNQYYNLGSDMMFDFYLNGIPKGKRYGRWQKKDINNKDDIELIQQYFNVNVMVAEKYLELLTSEQIDSIRIKMIKGGANG